jgi:uncharacterized membrane protein YbhN (UPF0104 family)
VPELRAWLLSSARIAVSLALLGWLLWANRGGWSELLDTEPLRLWPAAVVFAISTFLGALQWTLVLRRAGLPVSRGRLQAVYWVGMFFNNFLPTNVGGDLVKVSDVAMSTGRLAGAVAGTILDRMIGMSALVCVAFMAAALLGDQTPAGLPWWALGTLVSGVCLASAALLSGRLGRLLLALRSRFRGPDSGGRLDRLLSELRTWRADPRFVLRITALALVVQSLRILTHVMVCAAMELPLGYTQILQLYVLVPVLGVAVVLPISFNGLGVREFVATRLMPQIGIPAEQALAMQLLTYLVQVAVSLVGGVIFAVMFLQGRLLRRRVGA